MPGRRDVWRCLMAIGVLLPVLLVFAPGGGTASGASPSGSPPASGPVVAHSYTVTDLGALVNSFSRAYAINNRGQVVGYYEGPGTGRETAWTYDKANGMRALSPPDWPYAEAMDINDAGQVVGEAAIRLGSNPSVWSSCGFFFDGTQQRVLAPPSGWKGVRALGVNDAGQVVGTVYDGPSGRKIAYLYDGATMRDLTPWVGEPAEAWGINNAGQVVGYVYSYSSPVTYRAFLYDGTRARELGTGCTARAINDRGHVVGDAAHAYLYDGVTMRDLGDLDNRGSEAWGINAWDQVVGSSSVGSHMESHAFLYSNGVMRDLNDMIPASSGCMLMCAAGINDAGQIVGWGRINDDTHAVLLDPRPGKVSPPSAPSPPRIEPDYLQFGDQAVGVTSAPRQVRITNAGGEPLTLQSVAIAGPWSQEYAILSGGEAGTLAPGESRTLQISFTPKASGRSSATLEIKDDASSKAQVVSLYGLGNGPALQVGVTALGAPGDVDFGDQPLGTSSAARSLTLTNMGHAPLKIRRLTLLGAQRVEFKVAGAGGTITLAPGSSRSLTLRFTPMSLGARGATLQIEHSATSQPYAVALTGTGTLSLGDGSGGGTAPLPRKVELWAAIGSAVPAHIGKIRVAVGQCVTLRLRVQYPNGATADMTQDPHTHFVASPAGGSFSPTNVWCPAAADAGRSFTLSGEFASGPGNATFSARATVMVRAAGKGAH